MSVQIGHTGFLIKPSLFVLHPEFSALTFHIPQLNSSLSSPQITCSNVDKRNGNGSNTRVQYSVAERTDLGSFILSNLQKQTFAIYSMAERQQTDQQLQSPQQGEDMTACVESLEAALLPCLPARELQAIDRSPHPSHQIDVERHARDFMEAAKKLQLYFIGLQHEELPTKEATLRKDIAEMEEEMRTKTQLIKKHGKLILGWRKELKDQLDKHITELERV